jgi:hypothetical protein
MRLAFGVEYRSLLKWQLLWEGVSKSFRTGRLERELQMIQLSATRCSCIAILWVSIVSFAAITLCVASQWVFIVVSVYFAIDSVRKLLDTPSYVLKSWQDFWKTSFFMRQALAVETGTWIRNLHGEELHKCYVFSVHNSGNMSVQIVLQYSLGKRHFNMLHDNYGILSFWWGRGYSMVTYQLLWLLHIPVQWTTKATGSGRKWKPRNEKLHRKSMLTGMGPHMWCVSTSHNTKCAAILLKRLRTKILEWLAINFSVCISVWVLHAPGGAERNQEIQDSKGYCTWK